MPFVQVPGVTLQELFDEPHLWGRQDVAFDYFYSAPGPRGLDGYLCVGCDDPFRSVSVVQSLQQV